ncbi:LysR family transcriptional regulator [Pricia sp. S334]|uniref:LysR family transcriptional regulator n=1 Tax=Pricia mediterranea TaxID=3076079 RepID=A0ABU3L1L8_9FLAO|nr:LysR family transcriptional regulator [Pricia sp. S334]MDT7827505.1 LysR family transcriptional regulator [Pricia sp. S334]
MDHKLKIFREVALAKSFTKAAEHLFLSQPAVSKTIKNLETDYGKAFFLRQGNTIELTAEGRVFLEYTEKLLDTYAAMADEFSSDGHKLPSQVKIGASTTIGQYVLPKIMAKIQKNHPAIQFNLICGNTDKIQSLILDGQLDFGIVEGDNHNTRLHYEVFVKDELVLVTGTGNDKVKTETTDTAHLQELPFVGRELGSGTREVIANTLARQNAGPLNIQSVLGSTESIKSYVQYSDRYAFLPIHAIDQELLDGKLRVIDVEGLSIERWFYFVNRQGYQSKIDKKLQQLLVEWYNKR